MRDYAYVSKETKDYIAENETAENLANALKNSAEYLMRTAVKEDIAPKSLKADGSEYTSMAKVSVEPATRYDKETKETVFINHEDDSPVLKGSVEVRNGNASLTLLAKENITNGVVFSSMYAKLWDEDAKKMFFIRQEDIEDSDISNSLKVLAKHFNEKAFGEIQPSLSLDYLETALNKYFTQNGEKALREASDAGEEKAVNNAYAKYIKNEYRDKDGNDRVNERVAIYNHDDATAVHLGKKDGKNYILFTDFSKNQEGEPIKEGERPYNKYINNKEELRDHIALKEIRDAVSQFKRLSEPKSKDFEEVKDGESFENPRIDELVEEIRKYGLENSYSIQDLTVTQEDVNKSNQILRTGFEEIVRKADKELTREDFKEFIDKANLAICNEDDFWDLNASPDDILIALKKIESDVIKKANKELSEEDFKKFIAEAGKVIGEGEYQEHVMHSRPEIIICGDEFMDTSVFIADIVDTIEKMENTLNYMQERNPRIDELVEDIRKCAVVNSYYLQDDNTYNLKDNCRRNLNAGFEKIIGKALKEFSKEDFKEFIDKSKEVLSTDEFSDLSASGRDIENTLKHMEKQVERD